MTDFETIRVFIDFAFCETGDREWGDTFLLARGTRCRRRKQKCDLKYPKCSNCETSNSQCVTYDAGKQTEIPRNYVSQLEAQIRALSQEVDNLRGQPEQSQRIGTVDITDSRETSVPSEELANSNHPRDKAQDLVKSVRNAVVEPSKNPKFLGQSSGVTLARMVMASIKTDAVHITQPWTVQKGQTQVTTAPTAPADEASLPPRMAAHHLVDVYFQYRTPHLPIIQRAQVLKAIDNAYRALSADQVPDRIAEKDIFTTYMILAIALCNVPSPTGGTGRPLQSEGCFRSAIHWTEKVITYSKSDTETLRAVLLLAQFVSMCPWRGSLWHLTGIALRICVDMGLHWETEEQALNENQETLYDRRRLWHSAYQFDRVLGITLGRPFGIPDESVRVPLPNPWAVSQTGLSQGTNDFETHHMRSHNHLFSMSKLESEIKHVQQSQTWPVKVAYPQPNYKLWLQDIRPRLQEWYSTIPNPAQAHPSSIFANQAYWDAIYSNAVLLLHRPNSTVQQPSEESLAVAWDASLKLISSIKLLQRDGRLDVLWKSVHDLFMAGLTVIYCAWQSASFRALSPVSKVISSLQSCASTLSAMSVNFTGAIGCRDAFDALSSATIDWLVTTDAEETSRSRAMFEEQFGDLIGSLQPAGKAAGASTENFNHDMSALLSSNNFAFGEMLSSAAQWPDFNGMDFSEVDFDAMMGTAVNLNDFALA